MPRAIEHRPAVRLPDTMPSFYLDGFQVAQVVNNVITLYGLRRDLLPSDDEAAEPRTSVTCRLDLTVQAFAAWAAYASILADRMVELGDLDGKVLLDFRQAANEALKSK